MAERQHTLLLRLCGVWNLQLPEREEEEEISNILLAMVENVQFYGVLDWSCKKPLVAWPVVCVWIQAQKQAVRLYGKAGAKVVAYARAELAISLNHEQKKHRGESVSA